MEIYKNLSLEDLEGEMWKDVVGWEQSHQVSNFGRVRTKERRKKWGDYMRLQKSRVLSQFRKSNGYLSLHLNDENTFKNAYVHRLVVEAFVRPMEKGEEVNHLDKNKTNNTLNNLEICSQIENILYSKADTFEKNAKRVYRYSLDGFFDKEYRSLTEAANDNGVRASNIVRSCKGNRNMVNRYYFRYEKHDKIEIPPKKYKEVIATNEKGNIIEFASGFEAASYFGVKYNSIVCACVRHTTCKGYSLKYK